MAMRGVLPSDGDAGSLREGEKFRAESCPFRLHRSYIEGWKGEEPARVRKTSRLTKPAVLI